jgi:hypothetical protein
VRADEDMNCLDIELRHQPEVGRRFGGYRRMSEPGVMGDVALNQRQIRLAKLKPYEIAARLAGGNLEDVESLPRRVHRSHRVPNRFSHLKVIAAVLVRLLRSSTGKHAQFSGGRRSWKLAVLNALLPLLMEVFRLLRVAGQTEAGNKKDDVWRRFE